MAGAATRDDLARLWARVEELEEEVRALRARRVGTADPPGGAVLPPDDPRVSRRRMLGLAGAAAAGAVGATVATAAPAAAGGTALLMGTDNVSDNGAHTQLTSAVTGSQTLRVDNNSGNASSGGLFASASAGVGVVASTNTGTALRAGAIESGIGIQASAATGTALVVNAPTNANASFASHARLVPGGTAGPPTGGNHLRGHLWMDSVGSLWQCVTDGVPGTWVARDALQLLPVPKRVYDSRPGLAPVAIGPKTPLQPNEDRLLDMTVNTSGVPTIARGVLLNFAVVNTAGVGFIGVFKGDDSAWPGNASINWPGAGFALSNAVTSSLAAGKVKAHGGISPTDIVIDVVGYYL